MKTHRPIILLSLLAAAFVTIHAQDRKEISMMEGEKWWGSVTDLGNIMPFGHETEVR